MDNLEEDLTCSVCYSLFSDPRVLPCSHTFCRSCLEGVLQVSANFSIWRPLRLPLKCPNCRSVAELPPPGVEALPLNVSLRAIVEKFQSDRPPRSPCCSEHPCQPLNIYCVQDRQLVCGLCLTVGRHQGHAIDDLETACARERKLPSRLLERLTEQRWAELCRRAEQLEQDKARCEDLLRQDHDAVAQFFQTLDRILSRKKEAWMAVLDVAATEVSQTYDPLIESLKDLKEEQRELISYGTELEGEEQPLVFLEKVYLLRERVQALTCVPLPDVPNLCVCPRAASFLQERWAAVTLAELESKAPIPQLFCCKPKEVPCPTRLSVPATTFFILLLLLLTVSLCCNSMPLSTMTLQFMNNLSDKLCVAGGVIQSGLGELVTTYRLILCTLVESTCYYVGCLIMIVAS